MASSEIRPIRIEGNIAFVPLTQGYEAVIDAADVPLVSAWNWRAQPTRHTVYAVRTDTSGPKPITVRMHRVICETSLKVDHVNCDGLDNRRGNLRPATNSENSRNARLSKNNTSGVKGVRWNARRGKWEAYLHLNRRLVFFGRFSSLPEATAAYAKASQDYHGEFGRTSHAGGVALADYQVPSA